MPIFTGGQITSRIKAAELLQAAAEHRLARTREELIFNVSQRLRRHPGAAAAHRVAGPLRSARWSGSGNGSAT
ncbi:MAG: TolC family protein [Desulfobacterales bacterium]|nr:TolC family protein [Desulfobacterales bacterium]